MTYTKRALALGFAFGAGVAICGAAALALLNWYVSRPKPWNPAAITATFESINTEEPLVLHYVLQNNTDRDFRVNSENEVVLAGKLRRQQVLTGDQSNSLWISGEFPLFLPARQRARIGFHVYYSYKGSKSLSFCSTSATCAFVRDELSNLDGFVLFHEKTRYQIDLPNGALKRVTDPKLLAQLNAPTATPAAVDGPWNMYKAASTPPLSITDALDKIRAENAAAAPPKRDIRDALRQIQAEDAAAAQTWVDKLWGDSEFQALPEGQRIETLRRGLVRTDPRAAQLSAEDQKTVATRLYYSRRSGAGAAQATPAAAQPGDRSTLPDIISRQQAPNPAPAPAIAAPSKAEGR
jgi:hypothetical protein